MQKSPCGGLTLLIILSVVLFSCKDDDLRVKYPYSLPVISNATVAETEITYGESISLTVGEIKDEVTPLSTLEIQVVVNNIIIARQSVRTEGHSASFSGKYAVPFGPYMSEGAAVEVHLSAINVEGNHSDQVISTTVVHRPDIPRLYLVEVSGGGAKELPLTNAGNYVYSANNLMLGNDITFYLAAKVSRFGNVDWTGLVFGWVNGELGFVEEGGDGISLKDLGLIGYREIIADLYNFTVTGTGDVLQPVAAMNIADFADAEISSTDHSGTAVKQTWKKAELYLGENTEFTVNGVTNVAAGFTPDFFEVTGANTVKFLGETGIYTVYYLPSADYVWVEQPEAVYPAALWLDGVGFGRPQAPYAKTSSWNWNSPLEYVFCRKLSEGVFQATIYVQHEMDEDIPAGDAWKYYYNTKFFGQRGWGIEINGAEYALNTNLLYSPADEAGNLKGTDDLAAQTGVYRITIDTNAKTVDFVKQN
ncbi:MAG: DUF5016 domain-containing protein [Tannerella sp.]|nr:DUF5016 domain-containing protein [Tannerella sp.]